MLVNPSAVMSIYRGISKGITEIIHCREEASMHKLLYCFESKRLALFLVIHLPIREGLN